MSQAPEPGILARAPAYLRYAGIAVAVVLPLLITLDRFRRPFGEKYMFPHIGGSADLWSPYNGARALLAGLDPYMPNLPPALRDPSGWPSIYPPTMLLLYVPLVLATNANIETACQVFYWLNILALGGFCFVIWQLARHLRGEPWRDSLGTLLTVAVALSLNTATMFALDRGQSDLINALLCWAAILLFLRGRLGAAMAAVTVATAIKGYAGILAVGLLLAAPNRKAFVRGLLSAAGVTLALTLPVARHLRSGIAGMLMRKESNFHALWFNHSFKALYYHVDPAGAESARRNLLIFAILVTGLAWWRLRSAVRQGDETATYTRTILFGTSALAVMVGMPAYSGPYNYLLVLPGLLLLATSFDRFADTVRLRLTLAVPLGLGVIVALGLALPMHWPRTDVSLGVIALVYLLVTAGALSLAPPRKPTAEVAAAPPALD